MELPNTLKDWSLTLLVIGLVMIVGFFVVNQYLDYRYRTTFLSAPCDLCLELNDNVKLCPSDKQLAELESQRKENNKYYDINVSEYLIQSSPEVYD